MNFIRPLLILYEMRW